MKRILLGVSPLACAVALLAIIACPLAVSAQVPAGGSDDLAQFSGGSPVRGQGPSAVELLLAKRVDGVDWDEVPFEEVIDWLRTESNERVSIIPRWSALELLDVNIDTLVTMRLGESTVGEILTETLSQLTEGDEVTFRGKGNTLRISTRDDFNRKLEMRIYNVTDVLVRFPDFAGSAPEIDLSDQTGGAQGGQSSQPVFRNSGGSAEDELGQDGENDPQEILDDLVELIRATIEPYSWSEGDGGGRGVVRGFSKRFLVVVNTVDVHEQIAGRFAAGR